jgi:putative transposase
VVATFGTDITLLNDNGSENFAGAQAYLAERGIVQYFARPHTPKDKPHVENLIGKLQQECLDEDRTVHSVPELQRQIDRWLNDYHFFRPHQALDYLTPSEYCAILGLTIPRAEVSTM